MCTPRNNAPFQTHRKLMSDALSEAKKALAKNEIPVGAILFDIKSQKIIAAAHNQSTKERTPLAHAEMVALQEGIQKKRCSYLENCNLYVTLEPCSMCASAVSIARVKTLIFGAYNNKGGAITHGPQLFKSSALTFKPEVVEGVMAEESAKLLRSFFAKKR